MSKFIIKSDLLSFPDSWMKLADRKVHVNLVTDEELDMLTDPDRPINVATSNAPSIRSLREICEEAQASGARTLMICFDYFFRKYRPGSDTPRQFTPDTDDYIQRIAEIGRFAKRYGLGLELSILSPLEVGPGYRVRTGKSGVWMQYRKGLRDPVSGEFSVQLWRHTRWANNKGPINVEDGGVRVFAFSESPVPGTLYRVVDPEHMVEITDIAKVDVWKGANAELSEMGWVSGKKETTEVATRIRVHGIGHNDIGPLDRVLVVQHYRTPEMDYFDEGAPIFLKNMIDKYIAAGVELNGLYSDEMHIQQDWDYFSHHEHGEFNIRYVSDGFAKTFSSKYGDQYLDLAKYLVYFTCGQDDFARDLDAKAGCMHVFGDTPAEIRETALFRSRYYRLLQDGVVDLFAQAKTYAEDQLGHGLVATMHPTWAQSPTIDYWRTGKQNMFAAKYEYTSNFVWSNTVHQAAAACHDYFKWGDFLTGNGNDHAESGWLDRNYYGLALAASTGIINEMPQSYAAHWGMPAAIGERRSSLVDASGCCPSPGFGIVQDLQHRDVDVLMLYPLDLVAVDERFGSWMTQYAYANTITQAKLLERGKVVNGAIELAGRRFSTLVATFEPFPKSELLIMMQELASQGGRVIWSGPPPVISRKGGDALHPWQQLFSVSYTPNQDEGLCAPGQRVVFEGSLQSVAPQTILTDFLVDRIYPVENSDDAEVVARVGNRVVGTLRRVPGGGSATFLGYRPRDDQSASLGYETRNWFEVLCALGAYPSTGTFAHINDNTEYLSRTTDYLCCRFPNGAVALTKHFRDVEEDWSGRHGRNEEEDLAYLERCPLSQDSLSLQNFKVNGYSVSYEGSKALAFRTDHAGRLIAFAGHDSREITFNGQCVEFADQPVKHVAWAPLPQECRVEQGAFLRILAHGDTTLRIPIYTDNKMQVVVEGSIPGSRGEVIASQNQDGVLVFRITPEISGLWLFVLSN